MIPYGRQSISEEDIQAVVNVLRSDYLTQGSVVPQFEQAVADYVGANYAVAVNSGTSALHLACLALGLGKGDYLWTSPNTFVASANCALYCGAQVDFVDIDPKTFNMSISALEYKLQQAERAGTLPKIVIPVHFAGLSCDMKKITRLAKQYGFYIIEDACHAIGGKYLDKPVGHCQYSDITVFSFHPVKIITTAEGGMAVTQQQHLAERMALLRSHGITRETKKMTHEPDGPWYYQQIDLGFNYRMTDLQAALGLSQLKKIGEFVRLRHDLKLYYDDLIVGLPVATQYQSLNSFSALHLYPIQIDLTQITLSFTQVFELLRENGIGVNVHYIPVHLQPYYIQLGFKPGDFPVAEDYYTKTLSLPLYSELSFEQQNLVIQVLTEVLQ
ncbi:UDP-4-amino-4,6-dideoxy-N-acetyl-beta-L-altrosamine transaminase [uncultured Paraglaciecola sp.]|uniref:UDP-4-amino-4, 6-dideoxy-N-acetyl-beta-L-altrosamine transaminase n=1 Tax=uncultured Paraglaciecola sp. TaxID=1765024 RepID=UPI0025F517C0|nr:UDP-4-amino-4,6-dideoxy-N-acetyl-beta-L-altrosamine transaminase [uncultured Paraglaciecola sp.]